MFGYSLQKRDYKKDKYRCALNTILTLKNPSNAQGQKTIEYLKCWNATF